MGFYPCRKKYRNPFAMVLIPLQGGGSRRYFGLLYIEIRRRSSEKSSLEKRVWPSCDVLGCLDLLPGSCALPLMTVMKRFQ